MSRRLALALALLATPLLGAADAPALAIAGSVEHPGPLTLAALKALPAKTAEGFELVDHKGAHRGGPWTFTGARLADVLAQARLKAPGMHDRNRAIVTAAGADGYTVAFSWHELTNTPGGAEVIVAYERDGKPIPAADNGPLVLVTPRDAITGPRYVKNVARLTVGFAP